MNRHPLVRRLARLPAIGLLCAWLAACSAGVAGVTGSPGQGTPQPLFTGLPAIPLDGAVAHAAAAVAITTQNGAEAIATSAGASIAGTNLDLAAAPGAMEYGMYAFAPGTAALKSISVNFNSSGGDQVWLGLADYGPLRWQFQGPYPAAGAAQFSNLDTGLYLSQGGSCYLLVVAYDATTASIATVEFTTDDAPPGFSLSGNVSDELTEEPLSGVTLVLAPGGMEVTSDIAGNYIFSSVALGQYTLTPALAGYSFSPPAYELDLQGIASDVDFFATPDAAP